MSDFVQGLTKAVEIDRERLTRGVKTYSFRELCIFLSPEDYEKTKHIRVEMPGRESPEAWERVHGPASCGPAVAATESSTTMAPEPRKRPSKPLSLGLQERLNVDATGKALSPKITKLSL